MSAEPIVLIPSSNMLTQPYADDVSDLESCEDEPTSQPTSQQAHDDEEESEEEEEEEEDSFPDFPPNFDFQSKSIPPHFLCPLTKSIMIHPVMDSEGNTYERRAIYRWLDLEDVSPVTGNSLSQDDLIENKRRMAAIEMYREEVWAVYNNNNDGVRGESRILFQKQKRYEEKQKMMRTERRKFKKKEGRMKRKEGRMRDGLLTDRSNRLLMQMQEELDALEGQQAEEVQQCESHVEKHEEMKQQQPPPPPPKSAMMERIKSKCHEGHREDEVEDIRSTRKGQSPGVIEPPSRQPSRDGLNMSLVVRKPSSRSFLQDPLKTSMTRKSPTSDLDLSDSRPGLDSSDRSHRNSPEAPCSSLSQPTAQSRSPHCESKSPMISPDIRSSINSLALVQNLPSSPTASAGPERKSSKRMTRNAAVSSSTKSMPSHRSKISPAPPPRNTNGSPKRLSKSHSPCDARAPRSSIYKGSLNMQDLSSKDSPQCSITDRIIAELNGLPEHTAPALVKLPSSKGHPTTAASTISESQHSNIKLDHGWSVPIGVHKVICDSPGLLVTCDVHRRSAPVKRVGRSAINGGARSRRKHAFPDQQLIIPPGTYIEVVETQLHGDRVRGRIEWEESVLVTVDEAHKASRKMSIKNISSKLAHKKSRVGTNEAATKAVTHKHTGWVSLRWAGEQNESNTCKEGHNSRAAKATDEDAGPWTEPVPLGVYSVTFGHGLPVRSSCDRNSKLVGMLNKGQYVEVVETQIAGDRVRARCIAASSSRGEKSLVGWVSLFNAMTGSSGASPVPCGAYVTINESGCNVTEGSSTNSSFKSRLKRGSCVDIVSTRIEDGVVRGLISIGGYVTLIGPKRSHILKNGKSSAPKDEQFLMHVPNGVYKVVYKNGLPIMAGIECNAPSAMDLELDSLVQVVETRVRNVRVIGRIIAVINGNIRHELHGWIYLFESKRRWCKFDFS